MKGIPGPFRYALVLLFPALFLGACIQDGESLEGILSEIDCANGELTVVTDEGQTFVLTIDTPDCEAQDLQTGESVEVTTDEEGGNVQEIVVVDKTGDGTPTETTVVGKVVSITATEVTIQTDDGQTIVILIEPAETDVKADGEDASVEQLQTNVTVVVKVDVESNVAQTITIEDATPTTPDASPTTEPEASPTMAPDASPTLVPGPSPTMAPDASPTMTPDAGPEPTSEPQASPTGSPEPSPAS